MKKKIFLTSACALLAVSGVWGQSTIQNNEENVTYQIVNKISTNRIDESVSSSYNSNSDKVTENAVISISQKADTVYTLRETYEISLQSVSVPNPIIGKITKTPHTNTQEQYGPTEATKFDASTTEYQTYGSKLSTQRPDVYAKFETIVANGAKKATWAGDQDYDLDPVYDSEMYFFIETTTGRGGAKTYKYYYISDFNVSYYGTNLKSQINTYLPKKIEANNYFSKCTSVTIGEGIETIEDGAFSNANELTDFFVNNTNFIVEKSTGFLYTENYKDLIAVPSGKEGTFTLNSNCTNVYSKCLDNCTGVTLMTSNESVANNTTLTGGKNNQIVYTNADLTCDANNIYSGFVYGNNLNKAISTMVAGNSYDFRSTTVMEDINVDVLANKLPANVILFFAEGVTVSGTNIVKGTACTSLVLQDGTASYNNLMGRINADQITYRRTVNDTKWATVCVPFSWSLAANKSVWAGSLNGYEDNTITFIREPNPAAGVPLLMCNNSGNNLTEITSSGWVEMSNIINNGSKNGVGFNGIYNRFEVTTENNVFMYNANGSLNKAKSGNYCNPFRAYITYGASASAPKIRFVDEFENEVDLGNTTGLVEMLNEEAESNIYNVKGQKVNNITAPGVYVKNGKKVIVK